MTLSFDPGEDLVQVADGLQAVTVRRPGGSVATVVDHALRSVVRSRQIAESAGRFTASGGSSGGPATGRHAFRR